MNDSLSARELMARVFNPGVSVTNCLQHAGLPVADRPADCQLCLVDLRCALIRAQRLIEWLSGWRDDAMTVLARQDDALDSLQRYEFVDSADFRASYGYTNLGYTDEHGNFTAVARDLPPDHRQAIEDLIRQITERADGITDIPERSS